jgi:predicted ribosome quality control (RQC) complex YloA/Tae2 family protein
MRDKTWTEHLDFLIVQKGEDEATVLAQALRTGVETLYQEALVEAYLLGKVPRETALRELGSERLAEVDYQRDVLRRDVEWGLKGA